MVQINDDVLVKYLARLVGRRTEKKVQSGVYVVVMQVNIPLVSPGLSLVLPIMSIHIVNAKKKLMLIY